MKDFEEEIEGILRDLGSGQHLVRTKAQLALRKGLKTKDWSLQEEIMQDISTRIRTMMMSEVGEEKLGGLMACPIILPYTDNLEELVIQRCKQGLEDPEVRIRMAIGDVLGSMAQNRGVQVGKSIILNLCLLKYAGQQWKCDSQLIN